MKEIVFSITDMVRAKCIFVYVQDIIETVGEIKQWIKKQNKINDISPFRVIEVQSRFNKLVPISDVTLKIVVMEEIVAELQLTLQTNAAAYNFAHKIYELDRCVIFSKIKIVDNYFKQY